MKTIFELEEGKTYKAYQNNDLLHRKFRVSKGKLENSGLGNFAPCDWAPVNSDLKFEETRATEGFIAKGFNKIFNIFRSVYTTKASSFLQIKEGLVYTNDNDKLPARVFLEQGELKDFETKEKVSLKKISLNTKFSCLGDFPSKPSIEVEAAKSPSSLPRVKVKST